MNKIINELVECPCCLGAKQIMTPKKIKGFEYKECTLCNGVGRVNSQIADDFIFAMNGEDDFEDFNDDW